MTNKDNEVKIPQANISIKDSLKPSNKETIMVEQIVSKKCCICKEIKPVSEFYRSSHIKDGFKSQCKICGSRWQKEYRKTPRGRQANREYHQSEKGRAARKRHRQSEKARITERKRRQRKRLDKITNRKPAPNLHIERTRKIQTSTPNWDEVSKDWNIMKEDTFTSRQWRTLIEYVQNEAKDRCRFFFRQQKTDELIVSLMMLDISSRQLINLNNEDMPFSHGEPHINVLKRSGELQEFFIDRALETKIKAYFDEFRPDANEKDPFLASVFKKRLSQGSIYRRLKRIGRKCKLGIKNLNIGIFKRTLRKQRRGEETNHENASKSKELQWRDSPKYITATDAIKVAQANNRKLSSSDLSKTLKPNGPMRYMRKIMRKTGRCRVHLGDLMEYIKTLPCIKPKGDQIPDERVDEFVTEQKAKQAEIREQKQSLQSSKTITK